MFFYVFFLNCNEPTQFYKLKIFLRSTCLGPGWTRSQSFWRSTRSSVSSSCLEIEQGDLIWFLLADITYNTSWYSREMWEIEHNHCSALWQAVRMQAALQAARRQGRRGGRPRRSRRSRCCKNSSRKYFCHIQFQFPGCSAWLHPRPDQQGHLQHPDCVQQPDPEVRGGGPGLVVEREDGLPLLLWRGLESRLLWALIASFGSSEIAPGMN